MPTIQSLKEEIDNLKENSKRTAEWIEYFKKNQDQINKKLQNLEKGISTEKLPIIEKANAPETKPDSGNDNLVGGIILLLIGILLSVTLIGAVLGIPLIIIGIIILINRKNAASDKGQLKIRAGEERAVTLQANANKSTGKVISQKRTAAKPSQNKQPVKKPSFEEDVGMKWFARIGMLALVIGVGFFIKYAIDMNWINHLTRILLGCVLGIALIISGEIISRKKEYANWAKTLIGGGFAITYFAAFAAYHFEEYRNAIGITKALDIILLIIIVIAAVLFSLKDNSQIIAAESFLLGYATSLLSNDFGIMTILYSLFLTLGLVAVVSYKKWPVIGLGGVAASYLMYIIWNRGSQATFSYSAFILISYFLAFNFQSYFLMKNKTALDKNIAMILINSALFFLLFYFKVEGNFPDFSGILAFALCIFYLGWHFLSKSLGEGKYATANLYLSILYLTITVPIQLNEEWITLVWGLETLLLTILYIRLNIKTLRICSYVAGTLTAFKTLFYDAYFLHALDLTNIIASTRLFSFITTIVCFYVISHILKSNIKSLSKQEAAAPYFYSWSATLFTVLILVLELVENHSVWVSILLAVFAVVLMLSSRIKAKDLFFQSFIVSVILSVKVILYDSYNLAQFGANNLFSSTRFFSFAFAISAFYFIYYYLKENNEILENDILIIPHLYSWFAAGMLVLLTIVELSTKHQVWVTLLLSAYVLIFAAISKKESMDFFYQSVALSAILVIKVLMLDSWQLRPFDINDLLSSTRFFAFISAIFTLYFVSLYLEKRKGFLEKHQIELLVLFSYAATLLAFVLVLVEMEDFWISIGWAVLALIVTVSGFSFKRKHLRFQGMVIFLITIIKVFLYDTRNLETIYRTASYTVLGIILLLVSFIYTKYKDKLREIIQA